MITVMSAAAPQIMPLSVEHREDVEDLIQWSFGFWTEENGPHSPFLSIPWERIHGAWLDDPRRLAGVYCEHAFDLPVPGATLPAAGVSWVAVHPGDRRRGVASAMMSHQLHEARRRGVAVSALFASEAGIYGRFGYGPAATQVVLTIGRGTPLREGRGDGAELRVRFERADLDRHAEPLYACYDVARRRRPGSVDRPGAGLRREVLQDPAWRRRMGGEVLRLLTVTGPDDAIRGYALFRRYSGGPMQGTVEVTEAVAVDVAAYRELWRRLLDLDLTSRVRTPPLAMDDPLLSLLPNVPAAEPTLGHNLWCRLVDVPAALAGRRYVAPVDAVIEVSDGLCGWNQGRWHLVGGPGGARCTQTSADPQVGIDVRDLGALYLGAGSLTVLADAGLVRVGDEDAVQALSTALGWSRAPLCPFVF
jgi:predicted acetyltransferase